MSPGFGLALCRDDRGCEAERGREREKEGERERVTVHYSQRLLKFTFRKAGLLRDLHDLQSQAGHTSSFYFRLVQSVGRGPSSATVSPL